MTEISRRDMIAISSAAALLPGSLQAQTGQAPAGVSAGAAFSWQGLVAKAQALSRTPHVPTPANADAGKIGYDALHKAQFRPERSLWGDMPGATAVRLFPLSGTANQPVSINIVERGQARPLAYDPTMFDMTPDNPVAALGPDAGFAGFRIMNAARDADWLVFMGASYFRASGAEKQFGLSARAVTIDISQGPEEFPRFTTFWLERTGDSMLVVHALLDGPSITGAYRFTNSLDAQGVHQTVEAALFPRRTIAELGLMPMTSMFWYDQAHRPLATDWRPEIHDSDGLLIRSDTGAARFRALTNPRAPRTTRYSERNPGGFGLLQRDRTFDHYQDDGVFYERRPSLWMTPGKPLGSGEVRLYEFPTDSEYTDNVCCYWTPGKPVSAGQRINASYRLDWQSSEPAGRLPLAKVENIWRGSSDAPGAQGPQAAIRLVVDFAGLGARTDLLVDAATTGGTILKKAAYPVLARQGVWRTVLDIQPAGPAAVDVQLSLMDGGVMVSEKFSYPLSP
ncbi:glucan biosynthesis protein D [soil metagenome]